MSRLWATILFLLAAGCAADNPPPLPARAAAIAPPISSAALSSPHPPPAGALAKPSGEGDDFDALLAAIAAGGLAGDRAAPSQPTPAQPDAPYGSSAGPMLGGGHGAQLSYGDNLEVCLDGRWSAFCRHDMLTPYDAAQVEIAEYNAIVAACLDEQQRQFCQFELLRPADVYRVRAAWLITPGMSFDSSSPTSSVPEAVTSPTIGVTRQPTSEPARVPVTPNRFAQPPAPSGEATQSRPDRTQHDNTRPSTGRRQIEAASVRPPSISVATITQRLIAESIAAYPGRCPCPYILDRAGRRCGARSAYARPGGYSPICYPGDVTPAMVEAYRKRGAQ